jgi:hypothetical protein
MRALLVLSLVLGTQAFAQDEHAEKIKELRKELAEELPKTREGSNQRSNLIRSINKQIEEEMAKSEKDFPERQETIRAMHKEIEEELMKSNFDSPERQETIKAMLKEVDEETGKSSKRIKVSARVPRSTEKNEKGLEDKISELSKQGELEEKLTQLKEERKNKEFRARVETEFNTYPNERYVAAFSKISNEYTGKELAIYEEACEKDKSMCLSPEKLEEVKASYRVSSGLVDRKNAWAKEGLSVEKTKEREKNFEECLVNDKDCDKLPEADRKIASEIPRDVVADTVTKGKARSTKDLKILGEEVKKSAEEFEELKKTWKGKELTEKAKDQLIAAEEKRLEANLAYFEAACEADKKEDNCLKEEEIEQVKNEVSLSTCYIERKFQISTKSKDKDKALTSLDKNHEAEWEALPDPKDCGVLLGTKKSAVKADAQTSEAPKTEVMDDDDEKTPRNYNAETCKWVTDLPRKVVNGPGCGPKSRSQMCTGYVICEQKQGGGRFIRMSTCSADKCGGTDEDAVRCTKDMGYYSKKAKEENKLFMTPKLKKILSGAKEL